MADTPPIVLVFSASDPTSGAGMQADLLTLSSMGCHPLSVITAITVQDTLGVEEVLPLDADWIVDQARCVLEDMPVAAFKVGLVGSVEGMAAIAEVVGDYPDIPLILDPVLASGRGDDLADDDMLSVLLEMLVPQTTLMTPNSVEALRLSMHERDDDETPTLPQCAEYLTGLGCEYVLITGTHENTPKVENVLYNERGVVRSDAWQRLPDSYHGSGCTLASAIAAAIAHGLEVGDAVKEAQEFTWQALNAGFRPGMGQFIPDRMFWARAPEGEAPETGEVDDDAPRD
jgi:hydroxymethylpyrimidine/phosphomethylpyrimidine kinase